MEAVPLIHGRMPFAIAVRERMLSTRHAALLVELPPSLKEHVLEGVRRLPVVHAVVYREARGDWTPEQETTRRVWYVPIDPCDGIIESLRIAERERTPIHFVDAEIEQFSGRTHVMPDPHAVLTLGVEGFYHASLETLRASHRKTQEDDLREHHMAARVSELALRDPGRPMLFLCGMAHWERIHRHLQRRTGRAHPPAGPTPENVELVKLEEGSLQAILGETPFATHAYERHRSSLELESHDQIHALKELLFAARERYERLQKGPTLERASPVALKTLLDYTRKLTLHRHRLTPDLYTLVVAAKGVVGNDFALSVLETARTYPPNRRAPPASQPGAEEEPANASEGGEAAEEGSDDGPDEEWIPRAPGEQRSLKRIRLEDRPPPWDQKRWRTAWDPYQQCSWPPEDVVIENLRAYVSSRCLSMAGLDRQRTEEFSASFQDGLAIRETLRDLARRKIHVKIEPRIPGRVGAVVIIFDEDDAGTRYPWRTTWMAEHAEESTLAFYATSPQDDLVGPGVARAYYGGCMFVFPPLLIPDIWDDLRFEKARRPSERLLLAALCYSRERFVAYVSSRPPSREARSTAEALGKHVIQLPLSSFSARTLERVRRVHVLNGRVVRSWAARFIR